jgi:hypothetical protein
MSTLSYKSELNSAAANALIDELSVERVCVGCGCTDTNACVDDTGRICSWIPNHDMDVCSFCAAIAIAMAEADERDVAERSESRVQLYSPGEAQRFIEETRVTRAGGAM